MIVPLRFIPTGFGYSVCANRILAVLVSDSAPSKRSLAHARKLNRYVDMTCGHAVRSLLLLDDGHIIGCSLTPKTVLSRLNAPEATNYAEINEEEEES